MVAMLQRELCQWLDVRTACGMIRKQDAGVVYRNPCKLHDDLPWVALKIGKYPLSDRRRDAVGLFLLFGYPL